MILPAREFVLPESLGELEPIEEQLTGKYLEGTILEYDVEIYITDRRSVYEHFSTFERELRLSIPSEEIKNIYKKYAIFEPERILSVAKSYELPVNLRHLKKEEPPPLKKQSHQLCPKKNLSQEI